MMVISSRYNCAMRVADEIGIPVRLIGELWGKYVLVIESYLYWSCKTVYSWYKMLFLELCVHALLTLMHEALFV